MQSLLDFDLSYAQPLLGIDEVGLGCIAGPIVAAGVVLPEDYSLKKLLLECGVRDSKRLSASRQQSVLEAIKASGASVFISSASPQEIDHFGLGLCMDRVYRSVITEAFRSSRIRTVLLDGSRTPNISYTLKTIVKGDDKSLAIASASIVAKEYRDKVMLKFGEDPEFAKYGWCKNKGYPTREHLEALRRLGPSAAHRMSTKSLAPYRSSRTTPGGRGLLVE